MTPRSAKKSHQYLALLRGINVGGKNIVRMADLTSCCQEVGLGDVATYIQSGNVLFRSEESDIEDLTARVEAALKRRFGFECRVVVVREDALKQAVESAPSRFGGDPAKYRYDVIFLKPPLDAREVLPSIPTQRGVDQVTAGDGVLYFSRLASKATQSRLARVVQLPAYKSMTIRNWNTTTKLLALMEARRGTD